MSNYFKFEDLVGETFTKIEGAARNSKKIVFSGLRKPTYAMEHLQECCEWVVVEDIAGDIEDLIGTPILLAEEAASTAKTPGGDSEYNSATWTFYKLATSKGYVTIRWLGESNGYYSESVDFYAPKQEDNQ
jgi:hypothetical protein